MITVIYNITLCHMNIISSIVKVQWVYVLTVRLTSIIWAVFDERRELSKNVSTNIK